MNIVVLDFETTGFKPHSAEVTEVSAIKINPKTFEIVDEYNTLVKISSGFIPSKVVELTGITYQMTQEQGAELSVVKDNLTTFLKDCIVVAHNAPFDFSFLSHYFEIEPEHFIDTLSVSRILEPREKSHKLGDICKRHNIVLNNAHRAENDVLATIEVLKWQIEEIKRRGNKPSNYFNLLHKGNYGLQYKPTHTKGVL